MRWTVLLVLIGLAAGRPLCALPSGGRAVLEDCARKADASLRGLEALSHPCPELSAAVSGLGLDSLLPPDWQKTASARALADVAALADRYAAPLPRLRLDAARLQSIARTLEPPPAPPSLWERVAEWIRAWLEPKNRGSSSWWRLLPRWHLSPSGARLLLETLAALIVVCIAALVVNELRAAGLIGSGRPRPSSSRPSRTAPPSGEASCDLDALDSVVPRERPGILLRLLVRALTRSNRLGHDRDLTCRELIATARFDSPRQRAQFEQVALLAERARYGDPALAPAGIPEELLAQARLLYSELLAAPGPAPVPS